MPEETPRETEPGGFPLVFWIIVVCALLSLAGGGTLFFLSQRGALGANPGGGPGLTFESYVTEQSVDIWRNESWHPGTIEQVKDRRYFVRYDRSDIFQSEWLDASRLRARAQ
jgi:hypothetical protein